MVSPLREVEYYADAAFGSSALNHETLLPVADPDGEC